MKINPIKIFFTAISLNKLFQKAISVIFRLEIPRQFCFEKIDTQRAGLRTPTKHSQSFRHIDFISSNFS